MKSYYPILLLIVVFSSCVHPVYLINQHNVPGFTEAKQSNITLTYDEQFAPNALSLNLSYAIDKQFAVIGSADLIGKGVFNALSDGSVSGSYLDIGLGYYKRINGSQFIFENYLGYGNAFIKTEFTEITSIDGGKYETNSRMRYHKFFNQTSVLYRSDNKNFEMALALRLAQVNHYDIQHDFIQYDDTELNQMIKLQIHPNAFFIEPYFMFSIGSERIKYMSFISVSQPISKTDVTYQPLSMGIGVRMSNPFGLFKTKETPPK